MIIRRNALSFFLLVGNLVFPLTSHPAEALAISDEEMRSALIAFERCVKKDRTAITRPYTLLCGVPVYSRGSIEANLPYFSRNNYKPMLVETDETHTNRKYYYFKRDRDSQVMVGLERKEGWIVIVGVGVSMY
jgi:hypothetical protein